MAWILCIECNKFFFPWYWPKIQGLFFWKNSFPFSHIETAASTSLHPPLFLLPLLWNENFPHFLATFSSATASHLIASAASQLLHPFLQRRSSSTLTPISKPHLLLRRFHHRTSLMHTENPFSTARPHHPWKILYQNHFTGFKTTPLSILKITITKSIGLWVRSIHPMPNSSICI